jgi:hypothetical protein
MISQQTYVVFNQLIAHTVAACYAVNMEKDFFYNGK